MKLQMLVLIGLFSFSAETMAGKFKPVDGEDWPDTADEKAPEESDGSGEGRSPDAQAMPDLPRIKMLPNGSPDPESMRGFLK